MKKIIVLIVNTIILVHYSSAQRAVKPEDMEDYLPPKSTKFALANQLFELKDTSVITPNAVYVMEQKQVVKPPKTYTYIRFFKDGKAFISFSYLNYPNEEEFNDLSYGRP